MKYSKKNETILLLFFFVLFFTGLSQAATIHVDDDSGTVCPGLGTADDPYCTIQDAIDAARSGIDQVLVHDGNYKEGINFNGKAITVRSENGPAQTIIEGGGTTGGAFFTGGEDSNSVLDGFTVQNVTGSAGGGIYCWNSSPVITNCIVRNNSFGGSGGGINCNTNSSPTITNCIIEDNPAGIGGGIYCAYSSSPQIINSTISSNSAGTSLASGFGGGIYCIESSSPQVTNSTIGHNSSNAYGGGIISRSSSQPAVLNSILWGNTINGNSSEIYLSGGTITINYSDIQGGYNGNGTGNISDDPLFVGGGNYHLRETSPCIDKADSAGAPDEDIDGDTRPQGDGPDMGSDEYNGCIDADGDGFYAWEGCSTEVDCNDMSSEIKPGAIEICDGLDNDCNDAIDDECVQCLLYVPEDYTTISAAIDNSNDGCTIIVKAGTYKENISFNGKAITLRSEGGPEVTIIDAQGSGHVVTFGSNETSQSVLQGFTITGGSATNGGGLWCFKASPTIRDCIIRNNYGGTGGGIYCDTAPINLVNSLIVDNTTSSWGAGGISSAFAALTITNCTFSGNEGIALRISGHITPTKIINSIVWGNETATTISGSGLVNISYCNIQGGWTGTGTNNINEDPLFVGGGDYHLLPGSPCIDAAVSDPPATATDMDGNPRIDDPDTEPNSGTGANGSHYDMGAYEYIATCEPGDEKSCDTGELGACAAGTRTCGDAKTWSDCIQDIEVSTEVCDGVDNDCDGETDENLGTITCGVGACQQTVNTCFDGSDNTCAPGSTSEEVCDGVDNDCDGDIDEGLGTTTCGTGSCEHTVNNCENGKPRVCEMSHQISDEDSSIPYGSMPEHPHVSVDQSGNVFAVWYDERAADPGPGIYITKLDNDGKRLWDSDKKVSVSENVSMQAHPGVAVDQTGNVYIAWTEVYSDPVLTHLQEITFTKLDNNGNALVGPKRVTHIEESITFASITKYGLALSIEPDGSYIHLAWYDNRLSTIHPLTYRYEVFYNKLDPNGNPAFSSDVRVSYRSDTSDSHPESQWPSVASDGSGNAHVCWDTRNITDGGSGSHIYYNKIDPAGNIVFTGDIDLSASHPAKIVTRSRVAADSKGNAHIGWTARDSSVMVSEIYYSKILADGSLAVDHVNLSNTNGGEVHWGAGIDVDGNDNVHVAYGVFTEDDTETVERKYQIYYTKLNHTGGVLIPGTLLTTQDAPMTVPDLAIDHNENAHIIWGDGRESELLSPWKLYYTRFCAEAVPDADHDGWTTSEGDCDDSNPAITPESTTSCGTGACRHTINDCEDGVLQECDPLQGATTETCDGFDNNCNGQTDEDLGATTCGLGVCEHTINNCRDGVPQECNPLQGMTAETCDGFDNDCNGQTDEDDNGHPLTRQCGDSDVGECRLGTETCDGGEWSDCQGAIGPGDEICDGLDNNCDTTIDDGFDVGDACSEGLGACQAEGIMICLPDGSGTHCNATPYEPENELCDDNIDNNCDGNIDEDCADGDVNGDGNITSQDALMTFRHCQGITELNPTQQLHADVTGDDSITPADALCIFQKYLGLPSCLDE